MTGRFGSIVQTLQRTTAVGAVGAAWASSAAAAGSTVDGSGIASPARKAECQPSSSRRQRTL